MLQTVECTMPELLHRLNAGQIPMTAKIQITFDPGVAPSPTVEQDPTLALFEQWAREDSQLTPEQQAENERIYSEIEKNGIPRIQI